MTETMTIQRIEERDVTGKFGPAKAYDIFDEQGNKYGAGFKSPGAVGDKVEFNLRMNGEYRNAVDIKVVGKGEVQKPEESPLNGSHAPSNGFNGQAYGGSRNAAIQAMDLLLKYDAFPLPYEADKRYDVIMAGITYLTHDLYNQGEKARVEGVPAGEA